MASVNRVTILGRLGKDPELRQTTGGQLVCDMRIATSENYTGKDGKRSESTEWHTVIAFGKLADVCAQYLAKGSQAYVEGRLKTRSWDGKDGSKRYATEIVAQSVQFLGDGRSSGGKKNSGSSGKSSVDEPDDGYDKNDEPPF